jgi:hypothetical protein
VREHEHLVTVTAPSFTASIIMLDDACVRAAPILKWCLGKSTTWIRGEFSRLGYTATRRRIALGQLVSLGGQDDETA